MHNTRGLGIILFCTQLAIDGDYWMTEPRTVEPVPPRGFYLSGLPYRTRERPVSSASPQCLRRVVRPGVDPLVRKVIIRSLRHLASTGSVSFIFRKESEGKNTRVFHHSRRIASGMVDIQEGF